MQNFDFTSVTWHEVYDKVNVIPLEHLLEEKLALKDYGTGVQYIFFIFIAVQPHNHFHENDKKYLPRKKEIHTFLKLDYEKVKANNKTTVLHMMAQLFLDSILLYPEMKVKNFDVQRFHQDVQALFQEQGWLEKSQVVAQ